MDRRLDSSIRITVLAAAIAALTLASCTERRAEPPQPVITPAPAPAPAPAPMPLPPATTAPSEPPIPPATATDVETKKGTETGMVGGASGTTASGGKPGSGTEAGAGTGPAMSSGERTENKK